MKKIIILPLLIFAFAVSGQDFAPVGAKWCYESAVYRPYDASDFANYESYIDRGYYSYFAKKDTLVSDTLYRVIEWRRGTGKNYKTGEFLLYSNDSSVYLRLKNTMLQLYDFKLKAEDFIQTKLLKSEIIELPIFDYFYYYDYSEFTYFPDTLSYGYKLLNDSVAYYEEYQLYSNPSPVDNWFMSGVISPIYGSSINLLGETGMFAVILENSYDMDIVGYSQPGYTMGDVSKCDILLSEKQKTTSKSSLVNVKSAPGNVVNIYVPEDFGAYEAAVVDMQGRKVMAPKTFSGNASIKLSGLSLAVYVVKISGGAGFSQGFLVPVE